jgi:phosphoadenosine phosphosulfate reductase
LLLSLSQKIGDLVATLKNVEAGHSPSAFACSFGAEDMVLLDVIARQVGGIEIFSLDTGRLPEETHALLDTVRDRYSVPIRLYFPESQAVETWIEQNGANGFYRSVAQRLQCCEIRKVRPLQRALTGKKAWVTGLRREQSANRQNLQVESWDEANGLLKFNPLLEWTNDDVWSYIKTNEIPYNALHDRGYPSIGCAPCTRAVNPGENSRAGRWWWESSEKECGLHLHRKTAT